MHLIKIIISLALILIGIAFSVLNPDKVTFNYLWGSDSIYLSLLLFGFLLVGLCVGLFFGLILWLSLKRDLSHVQQELNTSKRELEALRMMPVKDA